MGRRASSALLFYGVIVVVAVAVLFVVDRPLAAHPAPWLELSTGPRLFVSIVAALLLAGATIAMTRFIVRRFRWAKELHVGFREVLGLITSTEIAVFALTSGIAEELLFRAVLQPWLGLPVAAILFGVVHIGPGKRFLPWTGFAIVMGFLLGALYQLTGSILGPIVAHILINYENFHFLNAHDPTLDPSFADASASNSGLVVRVERDGGSSH